LDGLASLDHRLSLNGRGANPPTTRRLRCADGFDVNLRVLADGIGRVLMPVR
jgi:hypothetical protein